MSRVWRYFLSRPHSQLLSRLLPVRRHGSQQLTAVLGINNPMDSRGYASRSSIGGPLAKVKRHLYAVLDDHKDGFGVHKLDLGDNDDHRPDGGVRRLPDPPALRLVHAALGKHVHFAAVGSSIVATGNYTANHRHSGRPLSLFITSGLIYDTKTAAFTASAHMPMGLVGSHKAAIAVGNSLYMLSTEPPRRPWRLDHDSDYGGGSLYCLTKDPLDLVDEDKFWGWHLLSDSSPWLWSHFESPLMIPFWAKHITAHAATHTSPPGAAEQHELFVSIRPTKNSVLGATFSFSTSSRKWRRLGDWQLPVVGHGHYDGHLDAWVGLHAVNLDGNMYGPRVPDGHLCAGNVTSDPTNWKVSKENLFCLNEDNAAGWRNVDAKLVQVGLDPAGGCDYCLMERLRLKEDEQVEEKGEDECWGDGRKSLLRLTSFRVERGQDGEPMVTARRPARSYEVSWHSRHFDAQVFFV